MIEKEQFGTTNIEISNITFDYNREKVGITIKESWISINDCKNVIIKNIRFVSTKELNEYPKAIFIRDSKNVSVTKCYSYIAPMLQMYRCVDMKANSNIGENQSSTFLELDSGFRGEIANNKVTNWLGTHHYSIIGCNSCEITIKNNYIESSSNHGYPINLGHINGPEYYARNIILFNLIIH